MTEEPYLILHKVRGLPAFDIAIRCDESSGWGTYDDPAPWWIIPTSGHRAYPWWTREMSFFTKMLEPSAYNMETGLPPCPPDWPDHYSINDRDESPSVTLTTARNLLAKLGLAQSEPIKRRKI